MLVEMRHLDSNEQRYGDVRLANGDRDEEIYIVV